MRRCPRPSWHWKEQRTSSHRRPGCGDRGQKQTPQTASSGRGAALCRGWPDQYSAIIFCWSVRPVLRSINSWACRSYSGKIDHCLGKRATKAMVGGCLMGVYLNVTGHVSHRRGRASQYLTGLYFMGVRAPHGRLLVRSAREPYRCSTPLGK